MKILAIETSTEQGSVALCIGQEHVQSQLLGARTHSTALLPTIDALLKETGLTLDDLDFIAFGAGPGAFTGVRLACGVAQGLALGAQKPLVPVNCLMALANMAPLDANYILATRDARMGEIYSQCFSRSQNTLTSLGDPVCMPKGEALQLNENRWIGLGSGFTAWPSLAQDLGLNPDQVLADLNPEAIDIARLAQLTFEQGQSVSALDAAPLYVRNKVAFTTAERLAQGGRG